MRARCLKGPSSDLVITALAILGLFLPVKAPAATPTITNLSPTSGAILKLQLDNGKARRYSQRHFVSNSFAQEPRPRAYRPIEDLTTTITVLDHAQLLTRLAPTDLP